MKYKGGNKMTDYIAALYYLTVIFIGLALISSFIIIIHCVRDSNIHVFNTWQFPMLLAILTEAIYINGKYNKYKK